MLQDPKLKEKIHQANISVHQLEAQYYELLHPEVYSKEEQKRTNAKLQMIDKLVTDNGKIALDVGAGTGNLTGKLLRMGYTITAVDISPEMCEILRRKYLAYLQKSKLTVICATIEELSFEEGQFDLVTCYSVLHHLPDYVDALRCLSVFLKRGGVIYIDHEASPFYWKNEPSSLSNLVKGLYLHSNPLLNSLYFQMTGLSTPSIDYELSDYWHKKEHALNHGRIRRLFDSENYASTRRYDYYETSTWIPNPLAIIYRLLCSPEMSCWIAKK
ncbi:MAG: class I SAM-dependent methyltransferase [Candidatus Bathyarchaeia archaeon]